MDRKELLSYLEELRDVILRERQAAKELAVDEMLEMTDRKEKLLKKMLPLVDSLEDLSGEERALAETVHSENLRNAYFFWSALQWVRESVSFISEKMYPASYGESGGRVPAGCSGTLLSGRV
jgi:hypothetical protein